MRWGAIFGNLSAGTGSALWKLVFVDAATFDRFRDLDRPRVGIPPRPPDELPEPVPMERS
jgi:hypothetical protein